MRSGRRSHIASPHLAWFLISARAYDPGQALDLKDGIRQYLTAYVYVLTMYNTATRLPEQCKDHKGQHSVCWTDSCHCAGCQYCRCGPVSLIQSTGISKVLEGRSFVFISANALHGPQASILSLV